MKNILILLLLINLVGCARNVDYVKLVADRRFNELGFQVIGYEGYTYSLFCGGDVWYAVKRVDSPEIIYTAYLCKWGDEIYLYELNTISGDQFNIKEGN